MTEQQVDSLIACLDKIEFRLERIEDALVALVEVQENWSRVATSQPD